MIRRMRNRNGGDECSNKTIMRRMMINIRRNMSRTRRSRMRLRMQMRMRKRMSRKMRMMLMMIKHHTGHTVN